MLIVPTRTEGPTPAGGAYAVGLWLDDDGNEVEPALATRAEIVEYDTDGLELNRTYIDDGHPTPWDHAVAHDNADIAIESQDGPKLGTWDLWYIEGSAWLHPVRTLVELTRVMGWDELDSATLRAELAHFTGLPVWVPAPAGLKAEVASWLEEHRV